MLLGVTSGPAHAGREALAETLLAGRFLAGTLTRVVKVLISFLPLFLIWAKSYAVISPSPLFLNCVLTKRVRATWGTSISVEPKAADTPWPSWGPPGEEPVSRAESILTIWHNPVKQCPLLGFVLSTQGLKNQILHPCLVMKMTLILPGSLQFLSVFWFMCSSVIMRSFVCFSRRTHPTTRNSDM